MASRCLERPGPPPAGLALITIIKSAMTHSIVNRCDQILFVSFCFLIILLPFSSGAIQFFSYFIFLVFLVQIVFERPKFRFHPGLMDWAIIFWLIFSIISILVNPYPENGWKGLLFKVLPRVGLFYIFVRVMRSDNRIRWFLISAIAGIFVLCLAGLSQYIFGEDFIRHRPLMDGRVQSTMKAPTDMAAYLMTFAPLILMLAWKTRELHAFTIRTVSERHLRLFFLFVFVVLVFCLGWTYSRGGWMAFILGMMGMAVLEKRLRVPVILLLAAFWLYFPPKMIVERAHMDATLVMGSFGRTTFWTEAWHLIQAKGLFGGGLNAYVDAVAPYKIKWGEYPHNCYLQMWAEIGIFGLLSFLGIHLTIFWNAVVACLKSNQACRHLLPALLLGYAGFLFHSGLDTFFYSVSLGTFLWILMALAVSLTRMASPNIREASSL